MQLGIERLIQDRKMIQRLKGKRVALLGHPASVTPNLTHSLDALIAAGITFEAAFGPQHGMRGEKQDNMIESSDYRDPEHGIPVFSLYGTVRRPTAEMLDAFDIVLVDLQDVGCRIYTFLTTLFYMMEALRPNQEIWVLDRPNPAGRPIEGNRLNRKYASFVGAAPVPMRHGLTLGEAAKWYRDFAQLNVMLEVLTMVDYGIDKAPDFGWPTQLLSWVNPSPNMPRLTTARQYAGTVLLEGTWISEGRGTTVPLEVMGAPNFNGKRILSRMEALAPDWLKGCAIRPCYFEPTFHKHKGELVGGIQIHVDGPFYRPDRFKPYRLVCLFLKVVHEIYPEFAIWRPPPYEYEEVHLPIEILSGGPELKTWVESQTASVEDWDRYLQVDESSWQEERRPYLLY